MKAVPSRYMLIVAIAIATVIAAVVAVFAVGTAQGEAQSIQVQPAGMSVPF